MQQEKKDGLLLGVIIGGAVGGALLLLLLAVVGYKIHQYYKWKDWLRNNQVDSYDSVTDDSHFQYPITDLYSKQDVGKRGRRTPVVVPYTDDPRGFSEVDCREDDNVEVTPEPSATTN